MIRNYFKIAWRNLMKSKMFSLINILGLTIGITVCMMIFLFVMNEFSFDKFHKNEKHIYRVMRTYDASKAPAPWLSGPYAPALLNDYKDDIKRAVRIIPSNSLVVVQNKSFNEKKVFLADADFFSMFSFPLLLGDAAIALKDPASIVLTENTAKKYFGSIENAMGQVVEMDKDRQLKVTGIAKNIPSNSQLDFDIVVPLANWFNEPWFKVWLNNNNFVYVELNEHADAARLQNRFPQFMEKYMGSDMKKLGAKFGLSLVPLADVYFQSSDSFDALKHGDKKVVYIFISVAALLLIIACINFMNLSTIRAAERSKEVGLRKVLGADKRNLVTQFILESVLLTTVSCVAAVLLLFALMPWYTQLLGYSLTVSLNSWPLYIFCGAAIIIVGFLAGSYPAFILASFRPIESLKGKLRLGKEGSIFRQVLVVVQFSISVLLIVGTIIISNQMNYIKTKQLGYSQEQTVVVRVDNNELGNNLRLFKNELESETAIASVSAMSGEPGGFFDMHTFEAEGQRDIWKARTEFADFEIVKTLGLKIIAGRNFSPQLPTDTTDALLINRTAAATLGFTPAQAIGKQIKNTFRDDKPRQVVGVVEDFNFLSLKEKMDALVISPDDDKRVVLVKLKQGNLQSGLASVKKVYSKAAPLYPFEYSFLDEQFNELYKKDLRQQAILTVFAGLAIFVACLGLFGLASFTVTKRFKEIGVRKVLGSSIQNIVLLLSKELLKPVIIATCIALPVGYWAMNKWLQDFAYKTDLSWWIFALAALITFAIAFLTVCLKALKAAMANPVKSLRTE